MAHSSLRSKVRDRDKDVRKEISKSERRYPNTQGQAGIFQDSGTYQVADGNGKAGGRKGLILYLPSRGT